MVLNALTWTNAMTQICVAITLFAKILLVLIAVRKVFPKLLQNLLDSEKTKKVPRRLRRKIQWLSNRVLKYKRVRVESIQ